MAPRAGNNFVTKKGWRPWRDRILHKKILRATGGKELFTKNTLPPVAAKYFLNFKGVLTVSRELL
jgi:hypothetical protein